MENQQIIGFLQYPDRPLVNLAVDRANLTRKEREAIVSYIYEGETAEYTAERLDVSVGTINNWRRDAFRKLNNCWSGVPWIAELSPASRIKQ